MEDKSPQLSVMVTQWIDFEGKSYEKTWSMKAGCFSMKLIGKFDLVCILFSSCHHSHKKQILFLMTMVPYTIVMAGAFMN